MIKTSTVHALFTVFLVTLSSQPGGAIHLSDLPFEVLRDIPQYLETKDYLHHLRLCSHETKQACEHSCNAHKVITEEALSWTFLPLQPSISLKKTSHFPSLISNMHSHLFGLFIQSDHNYAFIQAEIKTHLKQQIHAWITRLQKPQKRQGLTTDLAERLHICSSTTTLTVLWHHLMKALHQRQHHSDLPFLFIQDHVSDLNWSILWTDQYEIDFPWEYFVRKRDHVLTSLRKTYHSYPIAPQETSQHVWQKSQALIYLHFIKTLIKDTEQLQQAYQAIYLQKPLEDLPGSEHWEAVFEGYDDILGPQSLMRFQDLIHTAHADTTPS